MAQGDDERGVPALPHREHLTHGPPLRLQDGIAPPARRNPTVRIGCTFFSSVSYHGAHAKSVMCRSEPVSGAIGLIRLRPDEDPGRVTATPGPTTVTANSEALVMCRLLCHRCCTHVQRTSCSVHLHCSTRARRSSSAATACTGIRTVLIPKSPIFSLMYSGSPLPFRKILTARPIFCPRGSQTAYPTWSSRVPVEPPSASRLTAVYGVRTEASSVLLVIITIH